MSEVKIGEFYTIKSGDEYGIVRVLYIKGKDITFEYDSTPENGGYIGKGMEKDLLDEYPDIVIREGKDYEGFYDRGSFELYYRKVRDTELARKMYKDIHKEEDGFIWVK